MCFSYTSQTLINKGKFLIYIVIGTKYLIAISTISTYTINNKNVLNFPNHTQKIFKGVIIIDIELKDRNHVKDFFHKLFSRLENISFSIIQRIPEKFIPHWLMNWLEKYLDKRISELKQESIKMTWRNMYLQSATNEIHNRQQDTKKAPSDD